MSAPIPWQLEDHRDGERARFEVCGLYAFVGDADGDWSWWTISKGRRGAKIAEGTVHGHDPYHFDAALQQAEAALRKIVADRIADLRAGRAALSTQSTP